MIVTFWPAVQCEFTNLDDNLYVSGNIFVRQGLTSDAVHWAWTTTFFGNWIPLTWMSFLLDTQLFGVEPWGFHLTNVLLHAASAAVLFLALRRATHSMWTSAAAVTLFALHPLRVESVAWVSERKDVLCGLFACLAIWAYVRFAEKPRLTRYLLVLFFYLLALLAKPPLIVTFPLVLLLLDYWPLRRSRWSAEKVFGENDAGIRNPIRSFATLVLEKIPLFAMSVAAGLMTVRTQEQSGLINADVLSFSARLFNAVVSYVRYLGKLFWFGNLAPFYPHPGSWPAWKVAGSFVLLAAITGVALYKFRKWPWLIVGWLWFAIALLPLSGLVQVGEFAMADRFTYFPGIGLAILAAWSAANLMRKSAVARSTVGAAFLAVLLVLCFFTRKQVGYWHDSEALFRHSLAATGNDNWLAHLNLGAALNAKGKSAEALEHLAAAARQKPGFDRPLIGASKAAEKLGNHALARDWAEQAVKIDPSSADAHVALGIALWSMGDQKRARSELEQAARLAPENAGIEMKLREMSLNRIGPVAE